jgi:hypothetical protein
VFFDHMGTYDERDKKIEASQRRMENAFTEAVGGILGSDIDHLIRAASDYTDTFTDDGIKHRKTPEERRQTILNNLAKEEATPTRAVEAVIAKTGPSPSSDSIYIPHRRTRHKAYAVPQ